MSDLRQFKKKEKKKKKKENVKQSFKSSADSFFFLLFFFCFVLSLVRDAKCLMWRLYSVPGLCFLSVLFSGVDALLFSALLSFV